MSLDLFEQAVNEITDQDWSWWPFLWLRPKKHAPLTLARTIAMAILYGFPLSGLLALAVAVGTPEQRSAVPGILAGFPLAFLFLGSVIVAPMWNRRAARLQRRLR